MLVILLILSCVLLECQGLIKNCVTPSEWDSDTSNAPRCEIVSRMTEVICYGDGQVSMDRLNPQQQRVTENVPVIICNATYTLDLDVTGFKVNILRLQQKNAILSVICIPLYYIKVY